MLLSVIIPTFNREEVLCRTIQQLLVQKDVEFEIIVVDQSKSHLAETEAFLKSNAKKKLIRYIRLDKPNAQKARNFGASQAISDILLFIDDDIKIIDNDFLLLHFNNYFNSKVVAVAGQILDESLVTVNKLPNKFYKPGIGSLYFPFNYTQEIWLENCRSGNFSIRKNIFHDIGGFDEKFSEASFREESDLAFRLVKKGYKIYYNPKCRIVHIGEKTGGMRQNQTDKYLHPVSYIRSEILFILKSYFYGIFSIHNLFSQLWECYRRNALHRYAIFSLKRFVIGHLRFIKAIFEASLLYLKKL